MKLVKLVFNIQVWEMCGLKSYKYELIISRLKFWVAIVWHDFTQWNILIW